MINWEVFFSLNIIAKILFDIIAIFFRQQHIVNDLCSIE